MCPGAETRCRATEAEARRGVDEMCEEVWTGDGRYRWRGNEIEEKWSYSSERLMALMGEGAGRVEGETWGASDRRTMELDDITLKMREGKRPTPESDHNV